LFICSELILFSPFLLNLFSSCVDLAFFRPLHPSFILMRLLASYTLPESSFLAGLSLSAFFLDQHNSLFFLS